MGFHSFDLQTTIFTTLSNDSSLDTKIGNNKVFDSVAPQDTAYPYVVIGLENSRENNAKGRSGRTYNVDIECWSKYRGQKEIKEIMEILHNLFDNVSLNVSGATSVISTVVSTITLVEGDGITRHGIINIDFLIFD